MAELIVRWNYSTTVSIGGRGRNRLKGMEDIIPAAQARALERAKVCQVIGTPAELQATRALGAGPAPAPAEEAAAAPELVAAPAPAPAPAPASAEAPAEAPKPARKKRATRKTHKTRDTVEEPGEEQQGQGD